jgi:hypothetical protein
MAEKLRQYYSELLVTTIFSMIEPEPLSRITANQLYEELI